jgi:F-type H+-transporting ATPase subunit delta
MNFINELNSDSLDFKNLLSNSQINFQDKKKLILSLIKQSNALTEKLIDLLIHNKRVKIIGDIASSFIQLYNKNNNIKEATIITASPINNELESKILSMINIKDAKSVNLTNVVNPNIIGGFIIRFDGKEYNASVKQNLNNLKTELTN